MLPSADTCNSNNYGRTQVELRALAVLIRGLLGITHRIGKRTPRALQRPRLAVPRRRVRPGSSTTIKSAARLHAGWHTSSFTG